MAQRPTLSRVSSSPSNPYTAAGAEPSPPRRSPSPAPSGGRLNRKPVPAFVPPLPSHELQDTLNFHRRPSTTFDPVSTRSRDLISPMSTTQGARAISHPPRSPTLGSGPSPWPAGSTSGLNRTSSGSSSSGSSAKPAPSSAGGAAQGAPDLHRRRSSHSRQPSISLGSPANAPSVFTPQSHILPPHPVPTRTRAPIESFASVEMLQGQRDAQERRRGSEVFGRETGRYEGRAVDLGFNRRGVDPTEHVRQARGSNKLASGAPVLPPLDVDIGGIASQLRDHDNRRGSTEDWNRYTSSSPEGPSPTGGAPHSTTAFSFPTNKPTAQTPYILDASSDTSSISDDGYDLGDEKSFGDFSSSTEKLASSSASTKKGGDRWRTEILEGPPSSDIYGASHRPSIVALPVYPAPSGSLAKSWSFKKNLKKAGAVLSWFTLAASLGAMGVYLTRRTMGMHDVEGKIPGKFWVGWVFLCVEFLIAFIVGIQAIWDVVTYRSTSGQPKLRLRGDKNLPAVDVFVVSSGQSDQSTFDCAVAAASMDYPTHRFRVMVLDPTGSAILERDILKHAKSQGCPHLTYHRRLLNASIGDVFHTKANSINFGMKEASTFGIKGPGEFIAVLDADVIPERNFLRAALPAILSDSKVALVKTGQGFMNLPSRLTQATSTLMAASEPASHIRSGFLLRRSALVEVGGFPADSWIQDGHVEALLFGRGYKTANVDEILQWGMAKPTYGSQVNQMMVNRLGPVRTAARLHFFIGGDKLKYMSVWARLKALGRAFSPVFSLLILLLTVAYPLMFTYGGLLVLVPNLAELNILLEACLVMIVTTSVHDLVWTWSTGQQSPRRKLQAWVFSAPYEGVALLRLLLPTWLGGYARGSDIDINSVAEVVRPRFAKRLAWLIIDPHSGVLFAFASGIAVTLWRATKHYHGGAVDIHQTALTVLLTVGWPSMVWIDILYGSLVPYTCLLFPSRMLTERREVFLIRDTYSSVARPKHSFKTARPFKVQRTPQFITGILLIGWAAACVGAGLGTNLFV